MIKKLRYLFTLMLLLVASVGWAEDFTLTSAEQINQNGITVTFAKGLGGTAPTWYDAGLRLYANNTITISSESNITGITFNWEKQGKKDFASAAASVGNYTHPTAAGEGIWSGSAKTVTFTLGSSGQLQLNTFSVTVDASGTTKQEANVEIEANSFNVGETVSVITNGPTLTLSSSNANVASVSETMVTGVAAGTATITATWQENEEFLGGSKDFAVIVTDPNAPGQESNPYTVAQALDYISTLEADVNSEEVYIRGVVSEVVSLDVSKYQRAQYKISDEGASNELLVYNGYYINGEAFTSNDQLKVGDKVVVYGALVNYKGNTPEVAQNNKIISLVRDVVKESAGLKYEVNSFTATIGEENVFPILINPNSLPVTYSSSEESVATIDANGIITILSAGTTIINATSEETEVYYAGEAKYTLTVKETLPNAVTWDLSKDETASASATELRWISDQATMVAAKADASTPTNNYYPGTTGHTYTSTRFYTNSTLTIAPTDGYKLTSIVFTATTSGYASALANSVWANATASADGTTVTITPTDGTKAVVATIGATTGHSGVTVFYEENSDNRQEAEIAFSVDNLNITKGEEYEAPTFSNPNNVEVTFSSDNNDVATWNNGLVLGTAAGTAKITATFAGDDNYKPATVTLTVMVEDPNLVYSVADVIALGSDAVVDNAWVKGYIVGVYKNNAFTANAEGVDTNVALADDLSATETIPVQLENNYIRTALNLVANPGMKGVQVLIKGQLTKYFNVEGLKKPTTVKIVQNVGSAGYATMFYGNTNLKVDDNVNVSYISDATNGQLTETTITGIIPAGTGVLLNGEGEYAFEITNEETSVIAGNLLRGSDVSELTTAPEDGSYKFYMLSLNASGENVGFYFNKGCKNGEAFMNGAHKAYLAVPADVAAKGYPFGGDATGINGLNVNDNVNANEVYDLQGRRMNVNNMPKGIYIVNGKKVVIK